MMVKLRRRRSAARKRSRSPWSPDIAQCHAILAKITGRLGDSAAAKAHLGVAQRIFEQLGSTFWASRTANE